MKKNRRIHLTTFLKPIFRNSLITCLFAAAFAAQITYAGESAASAESPNSEGSKCPAQKSNSRFGVVAHFGWNNDEVAEIDKILELMKECGIGYFRTEATLWESKPAPNVRPNFRRWDKIVRKADGHGVGFLALIPGNVPPYMRILADHLDEVTPFVRSLVSRSGGKIKYWEVLNEPNLEHFWFGKPDAKKYTELLKAFYKTVKQQQDDAKVLFAGVAGVPLIYIEQCLAAGAADYFDVMNIHPYQWHYTPEYGLIEQIGNLKELMAKYNAADKPIFITEIGHSSGNSAPALPQALGAALKRLGHTPETAEIAIIKDGVYKCNTLEIEDDISLLIAGAKKSRAIAFSEIGKLNPAENPVLALAGQYAFPYKYLSDVRKYVEAGGIAIFTGDYPMFFDRMPVEEESFKSPKGGEGLNKLGIPTPFEAVKINTYTHETFMLRAEAAKGFENLDCRGRFGAHALAEPKPDSDFELIPVIDGVYKDRSGTEKKSPIIGIYKGKNAVKGSVIISFSCLGETVSENSQANFLTRELLLSYALGIEKITVYSFRSDEKFYDRESHFGLVGKDLKKKPAFFAYKTLTQKLGEKAKPVYENSDGVFLVKWTRPEDGVNAAAFWSAEGTDEAVLSVEGNEAAAYSDVFGKPLKKLVAENGVVKTTAEAAPVYVENFKSISLIKK